MLSEGEMIALFVTYLVWGMLGFFIFALIGSKGKTTHADSVTRGFVILLMIVCIAWLLAYYSI